MLEQSQNKSWYFYNIIYNLHFQNEMILLNEIYFKLFVCIPSLPGVYRNAKNHLFSIIFHIFPTNFNLFDLDSV